MSNLGSYQRITTASKKVGGPRKLIAIFIGTGAILGIAAYKGCEKTCKIIIKSYNRNRNAKTQAAEEKGLYNILSQGESNEGLILNVGDQFKVLESDNDAVLIEKIGDDNNPYFIGRELLNEISDYKQ